ncbi:MAG: hypothetical protein ACI9SP_003853 [Arenicella sp.]|jgi:hypothetical protein
MNSITIDISSIENIGFQGLGFVPEIIIQKLADLFDNFEELGVDAYSKRILWATEQFEITDRNYSDKFLNTIISDCKACLPARSFKIPISGDDYLEGTVWTMSISFKSMNVEIPEYIVLKIKEFAENYSIKLNEFSK